MMGIIGGRTREDAGPSPGLAPALAELGGALARLAGALDAVAFRYLWRAVAVAATRLLFNEVATEARFSAAVRPALGPAPRPAPLARPGARPAPSAAAARSPRPGLPGMTILPVQQCCALW